MSVKISRKELYNKVWSLPLTKLAPEFGISDSRLGRICKDAGIPRPGAGYWAKKAAGKHTIQVKLSPRFPGSNERIEIGNNIHYGYYRREDILNKPLPAPPSFEETIDEVKSRIHDIVKSAPYPSLSSRCHPVIERLLSHEDDRRKEIEQRGYVWTKLEYDTPIKKRRLRLLNAIFLAAQKLGCKVLVSTSKYDEENHIPDIKVGDTHVSIKLERILNKKKSTEKQLNKEYLKLSLDNYSGADENPAIWEDTDTEKIDKSLTTIMQQILLTGEQRYRAFEQHQYEWLVDRKAEYEEEERQRILEEEQKERELQEKIKQERINNLLEQASSLQKAVTIRVYVEAKQNVADTIDTPQSNITKWAKWALEEADNLDPIKQLSFLEQVNN